MVKSLVKSPSATPPQRHLPDFLCIGAKKAGTTWLHFNLRQHPAVWMPPVKELRYFDTRKRVPWLLFAFKNSENGRIARYALRLPNVPRLWLLRYMCFYRTDQWYSSLFQPKPGQLCGEIAPTYGPISETSIAHVKQWLPRAKIIYLLRNPVERLWSNQKMWFEKFRNAQIDHLPEQIVLEEIDRRWDRLAVDGNYLENLNRWQAHYAPDHFHIGFFDHLATDPIAFFKSTLTFLELSATDDVLPPDITSARNQRGERTMPASIRHHITQRLYPQIEALHNHFDNVYTAKWLQDATITLNTTPAP